MFDPIDADEGLLPPSWQFDDGEDAARRHFWPAAAPARPDPRLIPLARAQDAVARLEASADAASPDVATGLRARIALHEASGFLAHRDTVVHPRDLALHDAGLTGSYSAASLLGTLANELPWTVATGAEPDTAPRDWIVGYALAFARSWQALASGSVRPDRWLAALPSMGAADWPDPLPNRIAAPSLLSAASIVGGPSRGDRIDLGASYVAACVWRHHGYGQSVSLPFWSAPQSRIDALSARVGTDFDIGWLDCVTEAALRGRRLLMSLRSAEQRVHGLKSGARSHLIDAMGHAIRQPVTTARALGDGIGVSSRAALDLLKRLCDAGLMREATGRLAWRAFVVE